MTVIYSLSTAPFFAKSSNRSFSEFKVDRFELYTAAISSLIRRQSGNRTIMHCDSHGETYLRGLGLAELWNEIVTTIPDGLDGINPKMFWAAGKLFALRETPCPVLMLDTDFIAWQLPELDEGIVAAHREELTQNVYPPISHFNMEENYEFNKSYNYGVRPLNTAFLYINDEVFKQYYIEKSMEFMKSANDSNDYLTYMVYAEQRLLAILADYKKIKTGTLFELKDAQIQRSYTHTWGAKQVMRDNVGECERFCEKCRKRIRKDFPEWEWIIEKIEKENKRK
jgi:hypothetical protein